MLLAWMALPPGQEGQALDRQVGGGVGGLRLEEASPPWGLPPLPSHPQTARAGKAPLLASRSRQGRSS